MAREAPVMEYDEDSEDERPDQPECDPTTELDLHGIYQVNCVQTRRQLADFLASEDASSPSCLQVR